MFFKFTFIFINQLQNLSQEAFLSGDRALETAQLGQNIGKNMVAATQSGSSKYLVQELPEISGTTIVEEQHVAVFEVGFCGRSHHVDQVVERRE
jgi:hypothetical protein